MKETLTIELTNMWRTRFMIYSVASLNENYMIRDCPIMIVKGFETSPTYYYVDVFIQRNKFQNIREILYFTLDVINEFLSQVSFISYSPAELLEIISICPHDVRVDEEFEITIFNGDIENSKIEIQNTELLNSKGKEEQINYTNLLHLLRQATSTNSLELRFLNLFATLDFIADNETNDRVITSCPHCNKDIEGIKATSRYSKGIFVERGVSPKEYNQIRSLRGKIAHGSGIRNMDFYSELLSSLAILESVAYDEVIKRGELSVKRNSNLIAPIPLTTINAVKVSNPTAALPSVFGILNYVFTVDSTTFSQLKNAIDIPENEMSGTFGPHPIDGTFEVPREAWPY